MLLDPGDDGETPVALPPGGDNAQPFSDQARLGPTEDHLAEIDWSTSPAPRKIEVGSGIGLPRWQREPALARNLYSLPLAWMPRIVMDIRKIIFHLEVVYSESGKVAAQPITRVAGIAIVNNPHAGKQVEDLSALFDLGAQLGERSASAARACGRRLQALVGTLLLRGMRRDFPFKALVEFLLRFQQVITSLQVQPKLRLHPKIPTKTQRSIRSD